MNDALWLMISPLVLVLPGLYPAKLVAGTAISARTFAWALFFSILFVPLISFALAMILGATAGPAIFLPVSFVLGAVGLIFPRNLRKENNR